MSTNDVTVVLAHGAWADGSSWAKVIEGLKWQGIRSIAAALPLTTRPDDLAAIDQAIERASGDVVSWATPMPAPSSAGRARIR